MQKIIITSLLIFYSALLLAQPGSTTESNVELEGVFIEGNREKLLGNWDKAIAKFEEVLEKDKENAAAAYELARVYEAKKDLEKAEVFAKKAVSWDERNEWFKMYLAEVYQKNNKDEEAAAMYEALVSMQPQNEEYYFKWAYYLVRASRPEAAILVYEDLEKKMGVNEEISRHKHTLYMGMGNYKQAAKELETLIEKFPNNLSYLHLLGTFYEQVSEKEKAREVYQRILSIDPNDARARIALAEETKGSDDILFLNSLKPVFEDPKTDIDTKIKEILPYVNRLATSNDKNLGMTLLALTSLLETVHTDDAKSHAVLADVLYHTGQKDRALEQYKRTLEINDTKWSVWEQLLYIYAEKKDYKNLVKYSENALDIFPNQAAAYYLNGAGYNGLEVYKDALSSLQQALIMSARSPRLRYDVLIETGKAYFFLQQYAKSDNAFEEALKINDNDPAILKNYSYYLAARSENLDKAKDLATRLLKAMPEHPLSEHAMAFVLYKMKDYENAVKWVDAALQHGGDADPAILELYGDVLFQLGKPAEGLEYWQKAMDNGGTSELLEQKIKEGKLKQ